MPRVINWELASHPVNYITLFLMVFLFGVALHFVLTHLSLGTGAIEDYASTASQPSRIATFAGGPQ